MEMNFTCTVYDPEGREVAYVRCPTVAAGILSAVGGDGWQVKWRKRVLWSDGEEEAGQYREDREPGGCAYASESIDLAAETIRQRWEEAKAEVEENKRKRLEGSRKGKSGDE